MSSKRKLLKGSAYLLTGMSTINSVQSFVVFGDYEKEKDTALNAVDFIGKLYGKSIDIADEAAYDDNYRGAFEILEQGYDEEEYNLARGCVDKIKSDCKELVNTAYKVLNNKESSNEKKLFSQAVIKMFKDMFVGNYSGLSEDSYFATGKGSDFYNNFEALRLSNLVQLLKNILNSKDSLEYVQFVLDHKNLNGKKVAFVEGFGDDTEYDDSKAKLMTENEKLLKVLGRILQKVKDQSPNSNLYKIYEVCLENVLKHDMNELMDVGCLQKGLLHDGELMYKKGLWEEKDPYKSANIRLIKLVSCSRLPINSLSSVLKNFTEEELKDFFITSFDLENQEEVSKVSSILDILYT